MGNMGNVVPLHQPDNYKWVHRRIKHLWDEGNVVPLPHAQQRMEERGFDINDVQHIIRYGSIVDHSMPLDLWRYELSGAALDKRKASVIVEIDITSLIIITVTGRKKKR